MKDGLSGEGCYDGAVVESFFETLVSINWGQFHRSPVWKRLESIG